MRADRDLKGRQQDSQWQRHERWRRPVAGCYRHEKSDRVRQYSRPIMGGRGSLHGCQMAIARFLDHMC